MNSHWVAGYCPMGCGRTLFLSDGTGTGGDFQPGGITCSYVHCPDPLAVDKLLSDSESNHIVILEDDGVAVQHPLRERLDGVLFDCNLFQWLSNLPGPPRALGRYRVRGPEEPDKDSESIGWSPWSFERLEDAS